MDMLMIQLEKDTSIPLYEQLYEKIKKGIIDGSISVRTKLPSKRKLSEFLSISQTTVELAYAQLLAEGYIISKPRVGFFVEALEELAYVEKAVAHPTLKTSANPEVYIDFNPGSIDTKAFPFAAWRKYAKDAIDLHQKELLLLGSPQGELELREQIASYLYQSRGVLCSPEQIVIGSGTEQLLPMIMKLLGEKNHYAIENPGYTLTHYIFDQSYQQIIPINVDQDGMKIQQLEQTDANVAYITPSHQFPTGAVLSASRRFQLLNWAAQDKKRFIIEDDYDSEFRYIGKPIASLQGMDRLNKVIYLSTFSKSLMPSLRIAYFVLPRELLPIYYKMFSYYTSTVPRFEQYILAQFMKEGHFSKHLNRMRKIYRKKLEKLTLSLTPYGPSVSISGEQAGMHVVLTVNHKLNAQTLSERALQKGIRIIPITNYMITPTIEERDNQFLLGFGGLDEDQIPYAIEQLMDCWEIQKQVKRD
ncbi:PLP-dependent aminotransferase family protein [Rummeliibacillus sp. G93]|uniref:MocR-like pyridoxine biosynthesis transcription factor PdxR n=1 Tax=Rummeliibacillus TaxID=648802 RepID=UPI00201C66BA|nr:PLP-dependent aminotransferase family protein [Rummeliibacillus sp. G93]UQW97481.1 PLP-dependent aminotransferase family protein [Rummeliibacillus sp. G93]